MASYYFGLVCGGKFGHKLIASFGHIRSYVACAGIATVTVLLHALVDQLEVWLLLRFITGAVMMNQYMVIEAGSTSRPRATSAARCSPATWSPSILAWCSARACWR